MVSCDTCISGSSGYLTANHLEICWGDQRSSSLASTTSRRGWQRANLAILGRLAWRSALRSAAHAR